MSNKSDSQTCGDGLGKRASQSLSQVTFSDSCGNAQDTKEMAERKAARLERRRDPERAAAARARRKQWEEALKAGPYEFD